MAVLSQGACKDFLGRTFLVMANWPSFSASPVLSNRTLTTLSSTSSSAESGEGS